MDNRNILPGILIGIVAYSMLYLGKGLQKFAIEGIRENKSLKNRHPAVWSIGTFLNIGYTFVQWIALKYAPINAIAPLDGLGMLVLLAFSAGVLKEKLEKLELAGVFCIVPGIFLAAYFNTNGAAVIPENVNLSSLYKICIPIVLVELCLVLAFLLRPNRFIGFAYSLTAGTILALETVFKRITAVPVLTMQVAFGTLVMVAAVVSFAFTQLALARCKANVAVPVFSSTAIVVATLLGVFALGETMNVMVACGDTLIIAGIILMNFFKKAPDLPVAKE